MASRAAIAAEKQGILEEAVALAKETGAHDAEKRLERARLHKGRDPATRKDFIEKNTLRVLVDLWREDHERKTFALTPVEDVEGVTAKLAAVLREHGFETKADIYAAADYQLLKLPGISVDTLRRIRAQL